MGDGSRIFIWNDCWHPNVPLVIRYGSRVVYDAVISRLARVSYVIHNGNWDWSRRNTWELNNIRGNLPPPSPNHVHDVLRWTLTQSGRFTAKSAWEATRVRHQTVT